MTILDVRRILENRYTYPLNEAPSYHLPTYVRDPSHCFDLLMALSRLKPALCKPFQPRLWTKCPLSNSFAMLCCLVHVDLWSSTSANKVYNKRLSRLNSQTDLKKIGGFQTPRTLIILPS